MSQDIKKALDKVWRKCVCGNQEYIATLEARLEISPDHDVDGIAARDETIKGLEENVIQYHIENVTLEARVRELERSLKYKQMDAETWQRDAEQKLAERTEAYQENTTLRQQLAEAQRDAGRYGMLKKLLPEILAAAAQAGINTDEAPEIFLGAMMEKLDAAIDAALAASGEQED